MLQIRNIHIKLSLNAWFCGLPWVLGLLSITESKVLFVYVKTLRYNKLAQFEIYVKTQHQNQRPVIL